ncbi:MAG: acetylglutamate kinase, partial [Anaerolineae bacterium]
GIVIPELAAQHAQAMIASGGISGGMIPKVRSALAACEAGVGAARITDLAGLAAGTGTRVLATGAHEQN